MRVIVKGQSRRSLVWATLDYTRFNLAVIALGAVFLVGAEQGADVVRGLATGDPLHQALFYLAVFAWGWQSWFWARFMLQDRLTELELALETDRQAAPCVERIGVADGGEARFAVRFVRWYPRALGLIAMTLATVALAADHGWLSTHGGLNEYVALNLATTAVFLVLVVLRRPIRRRFSGSMVVDGAHVSAGWITRLAEPLLRLHAGWRGETDMPILAPYTIVLGLAVAGGTGLWAGIAPVDYGFTVGSAAVVFIGLASILPIGSIAVWAARDARLRPIMTVLAGLVVLAGLLVDNHSVRTVAAAPRVDGAKPSAWESLDTLLSRHGTCEEPVPVVMVATAGGGIRAAYWTATVLASIEDEVRGKLGKGRSFSDHLLAISGVSGGSVGATFYVTALRDIGTATSNTETLQRALSADFLGPALTGLLYQDLWQTFLPWRVFEDRGAILERAFEQGLAAQWPVGLGLKARLGSLYAFETRKGAWIPRLLLNGTNNATGQRMIASTVALRDSGPDGPVEVVVGALDQHAYLSADPEAALDMRLSTAAHNSARFPVISPGGMWPRGGSLVVDGGYFDNFGARTLHDMLRYVQERARGGGLRCPIRPVVVQISSDPELGRVVSDETADPDIDHPSTFRPWNAVDGPLGGILNTRSARGVLAARNLRGWTRSAETADGGPLSPLWLHFRMPLKSEIAPTEGCRGADALDPPLGWVLSRQSAEAIRNMLRCVPHNRDAMERLVDALLLPTVRPDGQDAPATAMN